MEDSLTDTLTESLMSDEPKITSAIKNFVSVILSESLNPNSDVTVSNIDALLCARIFLKNFRRHIIFI